jgi:protein-S-isoprenylcysteine O-methyltransferase Ste14
VLLLTIADEQVLLVVICAAHHAVQRLQELSYISFRHVHLVTRCNALGFQHHTIKLPTRTAGTAAAAVLVLIFICISCFALSCKGIWTSCTICCCSCICSCAAWLVALVRVLCVWIS